MCLENSLFTLKGLGLCIDYYKNKYIIALFKKKYVILTRKAVLVQQALDHTLASLVGFDIFFFFCH